MEEVKIFIECPHCLELLNSPFKRGEYSLKCLSCQRKFVVSMICLTGFEKGITSFHFQATVMPVFAHLKLSV